MNEYSANDNSDLDINKIAYNAIARLTGLYKDKIHLVYELLQNAEDCYAKHVKFVMHTDKLEMFHDGEPFTDKNRTSIRSVDDSVKSDESNAIGKFGVGFKSVFLICKDVYIHSNPENYNYAKSEYLPQFSDRIVDFIWRSPIEPAKILPKPFTTCFVFPFAVRNENEGKDFLGYETIDELSTALSSKLQSIGAEVMLFLKYILKIEYTLPCGTSGSYSLDNKILKDVRKAEFGVQWINALDSSKDADDPDYGYLMYSMLYGNKTVDIVFKAKGSINNPEFTVVDGKLKNISAYFPTEEESMLKFAVQAPFITRATRELVPADEPENSRLAEIAAELLKIAVLDIKERGWLTLEFLTLLPIYLERPKSDWLFGAMIDKTKEMFEVSEILPTIDGGYTSAENANIARGKNLEVIFNGRVLCRLLQNDNAVWLPKNLTQDGKFGDLWRYLTGRGGVNIAVRIPERMPDLLMENSHFFDNTLDEAWLVGFYNYVAGLSDDIQDDYESISFIKTSKNTFIDPDKDNLFTRPANSIASQDDFNFVADFIVDKCPAILKAYDIGLPDELDLLKEELKECFDDDIISDLKNVRLMKEAIRLIDKEGADEFFKEYLWLRCVRLNGECIWVVQEDSIYYKCDANNLSIWDYFAGLDCNVCFLDEDFYESHGISMVELRKLEKIGIRTDVYFTDKWYHNDGDGEFWYEVNAKCKNLDDFRLHLNFRCIDEVLEYINENKEQRLAKTKSALILAMLKNVQKHIKGKWQERQTYPNYHDDVSKIVDELNYTEWLFDREGAICYPEDISRYDLDVSIYGEVDETSTVYDILGFKKTESDDYIDIIRKIEASELTESQRNDLLNRLASKITPEDEDDDFDLDDVEEKLEFPNRDDFDLDRLKTRTEREYRAAERTRYEQKLISVRTTRNLSADKEYIYGEYHGFCQMCEVHKGCWRISALFLMPKKELSQLNLSLCPDCEAKYRRLRYNDELMKIFADEILATNMDNCVAPLDEHKIRFVKPHLAELQEILRLQNEEEDYD